MNEGILLSAQRKILGGYMNAEECAIGLDRKIMNETLTEDMFDLQFHKLIVRAINNLKEHNTVVTSLTVQNFLSAYGYPKTMQQEDEFIELMGEIVITHKSFLNYKNMIAEMHSASKEGEI